MAHFQTTTAGLSEGGFVKALSMQLTAAVASVGEWNRSRSQQYALQALTSEQLKDIGYPAADAPKPVIKIEAGLMNRLMTMR